jgi:tetratricopeptide (TPR) repeat protein
MDEQAKTAIVRIYKRQGNKVWPIGCGFLADSRSILTCRHVVREALLPEKDMLEKVVEVDFPFPYSSALLKAKVILVPEVLDLAKLELLSDPPEKAIPMPLSTEIIGGHNYSAFGIELGRPEGCLTDGKIKGKIGDGTIQLESISVFRVEQGFSGTPVHDDDIDKSVGMVVKTESDKETKAAYAIPVADILEKCPELKSMIVSIKDSPKRHNLPPKDELPEPDIKLLPGSKPIVPRNKLFTGRQEDLKWLANTLFYSRPEEGITGAVIMGWRGIGKSQLAVEFCYRYGRYLQGVHWIQANQDIISEIADCGRFMGLPGWPDKLSDKVEITLRAWREEGMHLIIFDNAENPQIVQDWLSKILPSKILVTSYQTIWPANLGVQPREIKTLEIDQSKELLCKLAPRLKKMDDADLNMLANRLDNLPLALDLAGRYLALNPETSLSDYLMDLKNASCSLEHISLIKLDYGPSPTDHIPLGATVSLSWGQLYDSEIDAMAKRIFRTCGYCAPNTPIPKKLLENVLDTKISMQMLNEALKKLDRLGLTAPTEAGRILHGLLAEFARQKDQEAKESTLLSLAMAIIRLNTEALKSQLPENIKPLHKHLEIVAQAAKNSNLQIAGALWDSLGLALRHLGDYEGAKEKHEQALKIDMEVYGENHPDVAGTLNNLGIDLRYLGDYEGAKEKHEQALKIQVEVYGENHPEVARTLSNLGLDLQYLGDYEGAKEKHEQALKIQVEVYGENHPDVARTLSNLGLDLQYLGDYEGAKEKHEQALKIKTEVYGENHPEVAGTLNNLGLDLQYLGDYEGARKCFKKSFEIFQKRLGDNHPYTRNAANYLKSASQN